VQCGNPPLLTNGVISVSSNAAGSEASIICNSPYTVEGSMNYMCTENGNWIGNKTCSMWILLLQVINPAVVLKL